MTPTITPTLPPGFRFLRSEECERLSHRADVTLWNGTDLSAGVVKSFGDATMTVLLNRTAAEITLDLDDPDYFGDGEVRDRRPPMDSHGEFVAVRALADDEAELWPMLSASVRITRLEKAEDELRKALADVRRILADRFGAAA